MDSILTSIKKLLGIEEEYTHFDSDITIFINSALMTLTQLGVGPSEGFFVSDKQQKWTDFIGDRKDMEAIKSHIYSKVRLEFDPPSNSFTIDALERRIKEFEWRLMIQAEPPVLATPITTEEGGV
jgi:hypothetical protein